MRDNVIEFTGMTAKDLPAETVIRWADNLTEAVVVGTEEDGGLYVAGTMADIDRVITLLGLAKRYMYSLLEEE